MPIYSIQAPNGKTYEIEGPEGATDEQVQAEVMRQFPDAAGAPPTEVDVTDTGEGPYDPRAMSVEQLADLESQGFALNQQSGMYERAQAPEMVAADKPTSFWEGVVQGGSDVAFNLARAAEGAADYLGVREPLEKFGDLVNPGARNPGGVNAAQDAFTQSLQGGEYRPGEGGRTVGQIAASAPTLMLPGGGFVQGAVAGALTTDSRTLSGAAGDAVLGGALGKAGDMIGAAIAPQVNPLVRRLVDEGIRLTPGQIAGQGGVAGRAVKQAEDILGSVPIVGGSIRAAQERGIQDLNAAAINRALRPIGQRLPRELRSGNEAVAFAGDRLRDAYRDVLPRLSGQLDNTFQTRINAIRTRANLPAEYQQMLDNAQAELGNAFTRAGPNGAFNGRTLQQASERLEDLASAWRRSDDPYIRIVGDTTEQFRQQLHSLARRQNPEAAGRLRNIDRGYASLVRVEKAATGTADGAFTPAQYQRATRMTDRSARRRASARGEALDQDLAGAANIVMTNRAAQGGSKDVNSLIALGAGAGAALSGNPMAMAGAGVIGAGSAAYSRPMQAAAQWVATHEASPAARNLAEIIRYGSRAVAPPVINSLNAIEN